MLDNSEKIGGNDYLYWVRFIPCEKECIYSDRGQLFFMTHPTTTVQPGKLIGLDHLRALAITMVVFYHYRMFGHPQWLDKTIGFGWSGVDLFFVLSGYLISSQLFATMVKGKPISLPEFYIKRIFRILPAYFVVLAIYFLIPAFHEREELSPLWKFLTFTQNFDLNIKRFGTFSHVWSLCVEEHFYLFFPLVLVAVVRSGLQKKAWTLLLALFIFGLVIRLYSWYQLIVPFADTDDSWMYWYKYMYYPTYTRLDGLLAGVSIAALFAFRPAIKEKITKYGNAIAGTGILVLAGAWFLCEDQKNFYASIIGYPLIAFGYGLLIVAAVSPSCFLYRVNSSITAMLAKLSFALYLSHKGVIHLVQPLLAKTGLDPKGNVMFLLCFLAAVAGAFVLNKAVEAPFLRLRQKVLRKKKESAPDTVRAVVTADQ